MVGDWDGEMWIPGVELTFTNAVGQALDGGVAVLGACDLGVTPS